MLFFLAFLAILFLFQFWHYLLKFLENFVTVEIERDCHGCSGSIVIKRVTQVDNYMTRVGVEPRSDKWIIPKSVLHTTQPCYHHFLMQS